MSLCSYCKYQTAAPEGLKELISCGLSKPSLAGAFLAELSQTGWFEVCKFPPAHVLGSFHGWVSNFAILSACILQTHILPCFCAERCMIISLMCDVFPEIFTTSGFSSCTDSGSAAQR